MDNRLSVVKGSDKTQSMQAGRQNASSPAISLALISKPLYNEKRNRFISDIQQARTKVEASGRKIATLGQEYVRAKTEPQTQENHW